MDLLLGLCGPTPDLLWVYCGFIDGSMLSLLWVSMPGLCWGYCGSMFGNNAALLLSV